MPAKIDVPFSRELLAAEYRTLKSSLQIARKYGVSKKYILLRMAEFGIERRQRRAPVNKVRVLARHGFSAPEIGKRLGVTSTYVRMLGREHGIRIIDKAHPGFITTWNGYRKVRKPDHPAADGKGYVGEARLVLEAKLGRYLVPGELPHHKDENKKNNSPKNLILKIKPGHSREHLALQRSRGLDPHKVANKNPRARGGFARKVGATSSDR